MKKFGKDNQYLAWGITAFAVIAGCMLLYLLATHWAIFAGGLSKLMVILSPFIWGFVIAYLLRPMMRFFELQLMAPLGGRLFPKNTRRAGKFGRVTALILAEAALVAILYFLLRLVLPQLYSSIERLVMNSTDYYNTIVDWGSRVLENYPDLEEDFVNFVGSASGTLVEWAKTNVLPQMTNILTNITSGVYYFLRGVYYVVVGFIVSVYVLYNKEQVAAGAKKLTYAVFSLKSAGKILDGARFSDKIFMNFISGQIVDSALVSVVCYTGCAILGIPYAILVSVIVGVTNIIPFFGPLIGAIPSAFIILMADPVKSLVFIVFIFLLQQLDGNVIAPKILGGSIGINGFWVMFSIILGAGLFGFAGMLLGVPTFVIIYTGIGNAVNRRLKKSGLPEEADAYGNLHHIDPETGARVERDPPPPPPGDGAEKGDGAGPQA